MLLPLLMPPPLPHGGQTLLRNLFPISYLDGFFHSCLSSFCDFLFVSRISCPCVCTYSFISKDFYLVSRFQNKPKAPVFSAKLNLTRIPFPYEAGCVIAFSVDSVLIQCLSLS